jgi:bifunctional DNA-binding transcriptional regulator/antitoxin component of YhaV-PrlF toxin-antitoxin module
MSLKSTVGIAKTGTTSLRATIPEGIVAFLELKAGDKLDWKMNIDDNDCRIVIIRKQGG